MSVLYTSTTPPPSRSIQRNLIDACVHVARFSTLPTSILHSLSAERTSLGVSGRSTISAAFDNLRAGGGVGTDQTVIEAVDAWYYDEVCPNPIIPSQPPITLDHPIPFRWTCIPPHGPLVPPQAFHSHSLFARPSPLVFLRNFCKIFSRFRCRMAQRKFCKYFQDVDYMHTLSRCVRIAQNGYGHYTQVVVCSMRTHVTVSPRTLCSSR